MKKTNRALIRFLIFKLMKKRSTGPKLALILRLVKKRPNRVLIRFLFSELMKKRSTRTPTRSLISRLMKRGPLDPTRILISRIVKKRSARTQTRSLISRIVKKKTRWGLKKRSARTSFLIFVYERHQSHYASAFDSCCYFTLVFS